MSGADNGGTLHFGYLSECPDGMGCIRPGCLLAHVADAGLDRHLRPGQVTP